MAAKFFGYTVGFIYLMVGTLGFAETGFEKWIEAETPAYVFWFRLNGTLNLVHFALGGALMVAAADTEAIARAVTTLVGLTFLGLGVAGFWLTDRPEVNVLALNGADIVLHLLTAGAALTAAAASRSRLATS